MTPDGRSPNDARFAMAERLARIGCWRMQLDSGAIDWSPGQYRLMGRDPALPALTAEQQLAAVHPDDRHQVTLAIGEALMSGAEDFTYTCRTRVGDAWRVMRNSVSIEKETGRAIALVGVCHDVTDSVAAAEALARSEERYRLVAEEASDIIAIVDNGRFEFISPAMERLSGWTADEVMTMAPTALVVEDDLPMIAAAVASLDSQGGTATYAYRMRVRSGAIRWFESVARLVGTKRYIVVTRDITARKDTEFALAEARDRAEAASRTKSRFLVNMSHELRTPLNAIIGFSDIIRNEVMGPAGSPQYREYAGLIHESGSLLLDLINDILDMSKIEAGRYDLHLEHFDIAEVVPSAARILRARADEGGVAISCDMPMPSPRITADKRALKQIILNLLSNAVKFTPPGGQVRVSAAGQGDRVAVIVTDTGIGIPAEHLPRLGRPFEQVSTDPTRSIGGTGLGLALVRALAQLHGGDLRIESTEGEGTTVTVTFPSVPQMQAATDAA